MPFADIIGHDSAKTLLRSAILQNRLAHAYLFHGDDRIGKRLLALRLAQALLCETVPDDPTPDACGACRACRQVDARTHPDFMVIEPDQELANPQIKIELIRDIEHQMIYRPLIGDRKICLIDDADRMTIGAANALLKTLEEPASGTLFLLVSNEPERLLPTIRSRCQSVAVPLPSAERSHAWLAAAGTTDGARWLALSGGAPLLAVELGGSGERLLIDALLGQLSRGASLDPLVAAAALEKIVKAEKGGTPMKRLMEWAQKWFVDMSLAASGLPVRYFVDENKQIAGLVASTDPQRVLAFARKALQYKRHSEHPLNSRLFLEDFFMGYAALFDRR